MAPGARLLGISCGEASLFFVLSGMDYILSNRAAYNIRVVNCSFGISGLFDANDPVNIATKIMHDAGITTVFSAGNRGSQPNSLNPYSVAPWVIGVGSGNKHGSLSSFSSRGAAGYGLYHPTVVAPGEAVVSTRALGVNIVGTTGLANVLISPNNDLQVIPPAHLARYTTGSGTSFAAPHVAGTVAMMLQANPSLTPDRIKNILQETASPMLGYSRYEVGAGPLNTYAAVRKAAFGMAFGQFRCDLASSVSLVHEAATEFVGAVAPGATYTANINVPAGTVYASVEVAWVRQAGAINGLTVSMGGVGETLTSNAASVLLAGQKVQKTGISINNPAQGNWTITVRNSANSLTGSAQSFVGRRG